ncbi:MAG TPA: lysophospholipid acyltransferase family protein [Phycisphaerae bacterium]|nr:lysophospholipid acyltransferase family protein [Phycisphaerae bacterium]
MRLFYRFMRFWSQVVFVLYFRGRAFGTQNVPATGGALLASNHQSFFDPVAVGLAIPRECQFMARDTLFLQPLFRRLITALNAFPVRRGAADVGAVKEILRRLKDGKLVTVFPEATRTRDGTIGEINANSLLIAKRADAAIVPTVIDGAFEAWPRTQVLPSPRAIHVTYAEPISQEEVRDWPIERIQQTVRERMITILEDSRRRRTERTG